MTARYVCPHLARAADNLGGTRAPSKVRRAVVVVFEHMGAQSIGVNLRMARQRPVVACAADSATELGCQANPKGQALRSLLKELRPR